MTNWGAAPPPYGQQPAGPPPYGGQPGQFPDPGAPQGTPSQGTPPQSAPLPRQGMPPQSMPMPQQSMPMPQGMPQGMPMPGYGGGYQAGYQSGYHSGFGMPVPMPVRKVGSGVLAGVTLWRLVIVVLAVTGFGLAMGNGSVSGELAALSQQASLLTAICYLILVLYPAFTGGRRHEPVSPWLRGALVVLLGLVSVTFLTMLGGALNQSWSLFEHLLTPLAVFVDWLFVGSNQRAARWWYPFTWLAFPLAYLLFYIVYVNGGEPIYPFLDPSDGDFVGVVFGFLAAVLAWGFAVYGLGRLKGAIADSARQTAQPVPPWAPQPGPQPGPQPSQWGPPPQR